MTPEEKFKQVIANKKAERDQLDYTIRAMEDAYDVMFGYKPGLVTPTSKRGEKSAQLRAALAAAPAEGFTRKELQARTGLNEGTIKVNLSEWTKAGAVIRVSEGRYRAKGAINGDNGDDGRDGGHEADLEPR